MEGGWYNVIRICIHNQKVRNLNKISEEKLYKLEIQTLLWCALRKKEMVNELVFPTVFVMWVAMFVATLIAVLVESITHGQISQKYLLAGVMIGGAYLGVRSVISAGAEDFQKRAIEYAYLHKAELALTSRHQDIL